MKNILNINHIERLSTQNGPGNRFTIWFQGCHFDCKDCFNKNLQSTKGGTLYQLNQVIDLIQETDNIEGVTFSGGEPFLQSESLYNLAILIKQKSLSILSYTGYTIEEIRKSKDESKKKLLEYIDILIDGKYEKKIKSTNSWSGSGNQRIHFLSNRYINLIEKNIISIEQDTEIIINKKGNLTITGFPDKTFIKNINSANLNNNHS